MHANRPKSINPRPKPWMRFVKSLSIDDLAEIISQPYSGGGAYSGDMMTKGQWVLWIEHLQSLGYTMPQIYGICYSKTMRWLNDCYGDYDESTNVASVDLNTLIDGFDKNEGNLRTHANSVAREIDNNEWDDPSDKFKQYVAKLYGLSPDNPLVDEIWNSKT